jgi:2,5-diketo-D-gluconate reductase A
VGTAKAFEMLGSRSPHPAGERQTTCGRRLTAVETIKTDQQYKELVAAATVAPVVDQVQFSPYECRAGLLDACRRVGVALEAYSALVTGTHVASRTAARIAYRLGRTSAQVLLRCCVQRQIPLIAKSTHRARIAENAEIIDFSLSDEEMADLDALDRTGGTADCARSR